MNCLHIDHRALARLADQIVIASTRLVDPQGLVVHVPEARDEAARLALGAVIQYAHAAYGSNDSQYDVVIST